MGVDDLVWRAAQGDERAIEELFRREWPAVYRLLSLAVPDAAEAQDLTQEVFLRAFERLDRYQPTAAPFRAYLHAIARNLVRERWRRLGVRLVPLEQAAGLADPVRVDEHVTETLAIEEVQRALQALPAEYQRVIRLRLLEGRSTADVAAAMNRSPGAVRVLQYRALAELRNRLRERARE
jgi:RNA polymerase sigma-70 factor (ECF subfamily)